MRSGADGRLGSKGPVLRFVGLFGLVLAVFYALYLPFSGDTGPFQTYLAFLGNASGAILRLLGEEVTITGKYITSEDFSIRIVRGCDGIEAMGLFAAAVLASPVRLRFRISFLLLGIVALIVVNVIRSVTLFFVGVYFPNAFEHIHFEVWPGVLIVSVLLCWLIWARWAVRKHGSLTNVQV